MIAENPLSTPLVDVRQLPQQLRPMIEVGVDEADRLADISTQLSDQLRAAGAFRLITPRELGGSEVPLATALDVYEGFARVDVSVALRVWNANFGFMGAFLPASGVEKLWAGGKEPIFSNSAMPTELEKVPGGYRLSGHWKIVTGIHHAEWLVVLGIVTNDGTPIVMDSSDHEVRVCVLRREQYQIRRTWNVTGMRATGSNDVIAEQAYVPADLTMKLGQLPRFDRPLYRGFVPTLVIPGCTAVCIGAARRAIDEVVDLARSKSTLSGGLLADSPHAQYAIAKADAAVFAAKLLLQSAAVELHATAERNETVTIEQRGALRAAMTHGAEVSRAALLSMYEIASSSALYKTNPLERVFRDGMAALQHANQSAPFLEAAGRVRLGLPNGMPMF
jgi:alkylation response protein AidB-like acyl-CoA dehydrogenase